MPPMDIRITLTQRTSVKSEAVTLTDPPGRRRCGAGARQQQHAHARCTEQLAKEETELDLKSNSSFLELLGGADPVLFKPNKVYNAAFRCYAPECAPA